MAQGKYWEARADRQVFYLLKFKSLQTSLSTSLLAFMVFPVSSSLERSKLKSNLLQNSLPTAGLLCIRRVSSSPGSHLEKRALTCVKAACKCQENYKRSWRSPCKSLCCDLLMVQLCKARNGVNHVWYRELFSKSKHNWRSLEGFANFSSTLSLDRSLCLLLAVFKSSRGNIILWSLLTEPPSLHVALWE